MQEEDKKRISQEELDEILKQHKLWLETKGEEGARADLRGKNLSGVHLTEANFSGANLSGVNFKRAYLIDSNFEEANLAEANFEEAELDRANFNGANLTSTTLKRAYLSFSNLRRAFLEGAYLEGADLEKVDLGEAYLGRASLINTNLAEANLEGANLEGAYLKGVNLHNTNLKGANLQNTHLEGTTLHQHLEQKIRDAEREIARLNSEVGTANSNLNPEQQEKIQALQKQILEQENIKKELEDKQSELKDLKEKLEEKLNENAKQAISELNNALSNTDKQITDNQNKANKCQTWAFSLVGLDIAFVAFMSVRLLCMSGNGTLGVLGSWSILLMTFPALLILLIAISLLRHQKQLIAEIRHYSMLKHKIELYCGLLKAAQYTAASVIELKKSDNKESAEYIQKVFDEIKAELLKSPNFDLNTQPHIFAEEGGQIIEMFKSSTDLVKTVAEISKDALSTVKKIGQ